LLEEGEEEEDVGKRFEDPSIHLAPLKVKKTTFFVTNISEIRRTRT
jgi:hypothetical protein